jgi:ABC-type amino acid transport substrate-binding protein
VVALVGRSLQNGFAFQDPNAFMSFRLASEAAGVTVTIDDGAKADAAGASGAAQAKAVPEPVMQRILQSGDLKVRFNPEVIPFSYRNDRGELVGFNVDYAYRLARDLGVALRLMPFTWEHLESDLTARRFDLALAGIYVTSERLRRFVISEPYRSSPVALIVRAGAVKDFLDAAAIASLGDLTIGVFDDPVMVELANRLFPGARVAVLPNYDVLPDHPEVNAAIWTLEQARPGRRHGRTLPPWCRKT